MPDFFDEPHRHEVPDVKDFKEFAETQAADLEKRLREEFPDKDVRVWANPLNHYRHIQAQVGDRCDESMPTLNFPNAIEEVVNSVRDALRFLGEDHEPRH